MARVGLASRLASRLAHSARSGRSVVLPRSQAARWLAGSSVFGCDVEDHRLPEHYRIGRLAVCELEHLSMRVCVVCSLSREQIVLLLMGAGLSLCGCNVSRSFGVLFLFVSVVFVIDWFGKSQLR